MENPWVIVVVTIVAVTALRFGIALILCGGDMKRLGLAFRGSIRTLRDPEFAAKVSQLLSPPPPAPMVPLKPSGAPLRVLALLQREGRLLDFLMEDIQAADDQQVGAGVRKIHLDCQNALNKSLVLEPVLRQAEGAGVEVPAGFDPSAIRLVGNVTGQPPFQGTLLHPGWRVKEIKLAPPPEGQDEFILMPAEVELA